MVYDQAYLVGGAILEAYSSGAELGERVYEGQVAGHASLPYGQEKRDGFGGSGVPVRAWTFRSRGLPNKNPPDQVYRA